MLMRAASLLLVTAVTVACGQTTLMINHSLVPHTDGGGGTDKPTIGCTTADQGVFGILKAQNGYDEALSGPIFLADGTCAVAVVITDTKYTASLLDLVKKSQNTYSDFYVDKTPYSIWYEALPTTFPPTIGKDGKALSTQVTSDDCEYARKYLTSNLPAVSGSPAPTFTTETDPKHTTGSRSCYVQGAFQDDPSFLAFFAWNNPTPVGESGGKDPFHIYYRDASGAMKTVWVHALRALPN